MLYRYIKPRDIILFVKDHPTIRKIKKGTFAYSPTLEDDGYLLLNVPTVEIEDRKQNENYILALSPAYSKQIIKYYADIDLDEILNTNKEDILAVVYSPKYHY